MLKKSAQQLVRAWLVYVFQTKAHNTAILNAFYLFSSTFHPTYIFGFLIFLHLWFNKWEVIFYKPVLVPTHLYLCHLGII